MSLNWEGKTSASYSRRHSISLPNQNAGTFLAEVQFTCKMCSNSKSIGPTISSAGTWSMAYLKTSQSDIYMMRQLETSWLHIRAHDDWHMHNADMHMGVKSNAGIRGAQWQYCDYLASCARWSRLPVKRTPGAAWASMHLSYLLPPPGGKCSRD